MAGRKDDNRRPARRCATARSLAARCRRRPRSPMPATGRPPATCLHKRRTLGGVMRRSSWREKCKRRRGGWSFARALVPVGRQSVYQKANTAFYTSKMGPEKAFLLLCSALIIGCALGEVNSKKTARSPGFPENCLFNRIRK